MTRGYTIGLICARGGSKGVPRKNLRPLAGKPLIGWAIEIARKCPSIDRVVISTEDEEIAEVARSYGAEVPFLRRTNWRGMIPRNCMFGSTSSGPSQRSTAECPTCW